MKKEVLKKIATSSYIKSNETEVSNVKQIKGLGKSAVTNIIRVDVKDIIDKITGESFKLDIEVEINGYIYSFSRIYKVSEVGEDKTVIVGNISLVDDIENLEIKTRGTIININRE